MHRSIFFAAVPLWAVLALPTGGAQVAAPSMPGVPFLEASPELKFDVASVKASTATQGFIRLGGGGRGQYQATNVPLRLLIQQAHQVQPFQLIGAPDWTQNERFDITARMPESVQPAPGVQQAMVRALLAERFKLVTHKETRELPVYALVVAKSDGKLPAGLQPAPPECAAGARGRVGGPGAAGPTAPPPLPQPGQRPPCATMMHQAGINAGAMAMPMLADFLSQITGRIVQDKTGLEGSYQFELTYTPDRVAQTFAAAPPPGAPVVPQVDPNGPSIYTALQEQLGLKLDSTRSAVDVVVVDSVDRPTEN
jgi:uncharacterized protein (TIGR03435 family)